MGRWLWGPCAIVGLCLGCQSPVDPLTRGARTLGAPVAVPPGWQLVHLSDARTVEFSSLQGKVVFVNLWATWCPPCVGELPSIQALHDRLADDDRIAFVLVGLEPAEPLRQFLEQNEYRLPVFRSSGTLPDVFRTRGIPATLVVDKQQRIRSKVIGAANWNQDGVAAFLRALADEADTPEAASGSREPDGRR